MITKTFNITTDIINLLDAWYTINSQEASRLECTIYKRREQSALIKTTPAISCSNRDETTLIILVAILSTICLALAGLTLARSIRRCRYQRIDQ